MRIAQSSLNRSSPEPTSLLSRRPTFAASIALAALLFFAASAQSGSAQTGLGNIGPTNGQVAAVIAGFGAVVVVVTLVAVNHSHHTLKGCVTSSASGLQLETGDHQAYLLEGDTLGSIKPGDRVKLNGSRVKKTKVPAGPRVFTVQKLQKDYGPCH